MQITANGKNINTYPFKNLLIQGEKFSETIVFLVDRFHNETDLGKCSFLIRGVTEKNEEAEQVLTVYVFEKSVALFWNISDNFTVTAGRLQLEIKALLADNSGTGQRLILKYNIQMRHTKNITNDMRQRLILKYNMAPIFIKESPLGNNTPMPDVREQVLNEIDMAVSDGLNQIQQLIDSFDISEVEARLDNMEAQLAELNARPKVEPLTQQQYNRKAHEPNVLYVIVQE